MWPKQSILMGTYTLVLLSKILTFSFADDLTDVLTSIRIELSKNLDLFKGNPWQDFVENFKRNKFNVGEKMVLAYGLDTKSRSFGNNIGAYFEVS